ncbi:hypothetical protein AC1031_021982 [Aphanomyces cochlioides]|nr:hypothetical protein AC1031_021982 [Aphanomyces cochlioides]
MTNKQVVSLISGESSCVQAPKIQSTMKRELDPLHFGCLSLDTRAPLHTLHASLFCLDQKFAALGLAWIHCSPFFCCFSSDQTSLWTFVVLKFRQQLSIERHGRTSAFLLDTIKS